MQGKGKNGSSPIRQGVGSEALATNDPLVQLKGLPKSVYWYRLALFVGSFVLLGVPLAAYVAAFDPETPAIRWAAYPICLLLAISLLELGILTPWTIKNFTMTLTPSEMETINGRLLRTRSKTRIASILAVEVNAGPLLSAFGLSKVKFYGVATIPDLPPLPTAVAIDVQEAIIKGIHHAIAPGADLTPDAATRRKRDTDRPGRQ